MSDIIQTVETTVKPVVTKESGIIAKFFKAIGNGISMDFPFMSAHNLNIPNLAGRQVTVTLMASIEIR